MFFFLRNRLFSFVFFFEYDVLQLYLSIVSFAERRAVLPHWIVLRNLKQSEKNKTLCHDNKN